MMMRASNVSLLKSSIMTAADQDRDGGTQVEGRAKARPASAANLNVVEEADAGGEVAEIFARYRLHFGRPAVAGILKCFATNPVLLRNMMGLAEGFIFVDSHLSRRTKEMIATLVSTENDCPYCADSHGYALCSLGGSAAELAAIQACDLEAQALDSRHRALLNFADRVTRSSSTIHRSDVESLMMAGWSEIQIAEAIHIAALFAAFNRIANAFGLSSQHLLENGRPQSE
jgi:uncharacterized peroxidase-related enzyme